MRICRRIQLHNVKTVSVRICLRIYVCMCVRVRGWLHWSCVLSRLQVWVRGWFHWSAHTLRIPRFDQPGSLEAPSAFDLWRIPWCFDLGHGRKLCLPDVPQRICPSADDITKRQVSLMQFRCAYACAHSCIVVLISVLVLVLVLVFWSLSCLGLGRKLCLPDVPQRI